MFNLFISTSLSPYLECDLIQLSNIFLEWPGSQNSYCYMYTFIHSFPCRPARPRPSQFSSRLYNLFDPSQLPRQHDLTFMQSARMENKRKKMARPLRWEMFGEREQIPWETPKRIDDKRKELKWHSLCTAMQYNIRGKNKWWIIDLQYVTSRLPKATCALASADIYGQAAIKWRRQRSWERRKPWKLDLNAQPPQPRW